MKPYTCATIQMKAIEQYFHVVLFVMLYKVLLTFKSVKETPVYGYIKTMESDLNLPIYVLLELYVVYRCFCRNVCCTEQCSWS